MDDGIYTTIIEHYGIVPIDKATINAGTSPGSRMRQWNPLIDRADAPAVVNNRGSSGLGTRPEAIKAVPIRHWGRWIASVVILYIFAALIYSLAKNDNLQWDVVADWMFRLVLRGLLRTLELTFIAMAIGMLGGASSPSCACRRTTCCRDCPGSTSGSSGVRRYTCRSSSGATSRILYPKLFLSLPFTGLVFGDWQPPAVIGGFVASILALGLNEAAYAAELVQSGHHLGGQGTDRSGRVAWHVVSLTMRRIVLPQAMRVIIPTDGQRDHLDAQDDVARRRHRRPRADDQRQIAYSQNFMIMPLLIVACIWYIFLTTLLTIGQHYLERHFGRGFGANETETAEKRAMKRLATEGGRRQ